MKAGREGWRATAGMVGVTLWLGIAALAASAVAGEPPRPRIALVLGGGGARGAAHIGVLEVLEEENIPIDYVVGTSMGAIVGALVAQGMSATEIEAQVRAADWQRIFTDEPPREHVAFRRKQDDLQDLVPLDLGVDGWRPVLPRGLLAGQNLSLLLRRLTLPSAGIDDFDRLPSPFRAVAADIETGEAVVLAKGDLTMAVRASMAVPGIFAPVPWGDRWLVDGGIARNLPVDVARDLGADVVIAVEVGRPTADRDELKSLLDVFLQVTYILINRNSVKQIATLGAEDTLLRPDLEGVSAADFSEYERAILAGRAAAREHVSSLRRYAVPANRSRQRPRNGGPAGDAVVHVDSLEIENRSSASTPEILGRLTLESGTDVPVSQLQRDVTRIYGMGAFEQVDYAVVPDAGRNRLVITTTGRSLGPTHLRAGLTLRSTFDGDSGVTLRLDVTRMQLNRRGAEWKNRIRIGDTERLLSELYQPLDYGGLFFLAPRIEGERHTRNVFVESERVAQYLVRTYGVGLDAGMQLGPHWGEVRIGLVEDWASADRRIGPPDLLEYDLRRVAYVGSLVLDRLDRASFPRHGGYAYARAHLVRAALGSDVTYDRLSTGLTVAGTRGGNTLTGTLLVESSLDSTLPAFDRFGLGGLHRLSGYRRDQLTGGHVALGELIYRRKIGSLPRGVGGASYLGASVEAGNAWQDGTDVGLPDLIPAGSVFVGVDTVLGPLHLAYGQAERGHRSGYLILGQTP